jgi:hypothetical protein
MSHHHHSRPSLPTPPPPKIKHRTSLELSIARQSQAQALGVEDFGGFGGSEPTAAKPKAPNFRQQAKRIFGGGGFL